ncbi:hypothetical protein MAR_003201 [Mya arenaria]|uniref:Uncharacterized protein n=1 Tax=Mya arenaria TaxID=6604 RepID=A0ABY7G8W7_MYAAR|nr:hypothetical protein MAR_003201 [Mya arenaria]
MGEECIFVAVGAVLGVLTLIIVYVIYYWCKNKKRRALVQFFDTTSFKHISKTFRSRYQNATFEIKYSKEEIVSDIPLVVFCLSTSRVEDECRSALEGILYTPSTTLLVVLHRLKDSDTSAVISFFKFDGHRNWIGFVNELLEQQHDNHGNQKNGLRLWEDGRGRRSWEVQKRHSIDQEKIRHEVLRKLNRECTICQTQMTSLGNQKAMLSRNLVIERCCLAGASK